MYRDAEDARQDSALLHIHPLNWPRNQFFCCDPTDYRWHDSADRLRMKLWSLGVPFECDLDTVAGRTQLRILFPHGAAGDRLSGRAARTGTIARRLIATSCGSTTESRKSPAASSTATDLETDGYR